MNIEAIVSKLNDECEYRRYKCETWRSNEFEIQNGILICNTMACHKTSNDNWDLCDTCKQTIESYQNPSMNMLREISELKMEIADIKVTLKEIKDMIASHGSTTKSAR